jgi:hypothetical protein
MSNKHENYLKAKEAYYKKNRVYLDRYRKSKDLTYFEKRLLTVISGYAKGKWSDLKEILDNMTPGEDHFLNGEYFFAYGYINWKLGNLKGCIDKTQHALQAYS